MTKIRLNLADHPALLARVVDLSQGDDAMPGVRVVARALEVFEAASPEVWTDSRVAEIFVGYLGDRSNAGDLSKVALKVLKAAGESAGRSAQIVEAVLDVVQRRNRMESDKELRLLALATLAAFGPEAGRTHLVVPSIVARCEPRGLPGTRLPPEDVIAAVAALIGNASPDRAVKELAECSPWRHSTAKMLPLYEAILTRRIPAGKTRCDAGIPQEPHFKGRSIRNRQC